MRHGSLSWITGTALVASLAAPFVGLAQERAQEQPKKHRHYTLVDMGTLGSPYGVSNSIDSRGVAVGGVLTSVPDPICTGPWDQVFNCNYEHAFKWQKGVLTDLGTLPGGYNSIAASINSRGAVFGTSENGLVDDVYGVRAFVTTIWNDGEVQGLETLGGGLSYSGYAVSINDRGRAVGASMNTSPDPDGFGPAIVFPGAIIPGNHWHAVLWQDGTIQDLGTLGDGLDSYALFVNQRGQVAGLSYTNSIPNPQFGIPTINPFFWENGQMIDIGTLGGAFARVNGLNNRGQVVGSSNVTMDGSLDHAFLWERGSLLDLGTLGGDFSGANWIDDSGEIVGFASTSDNLQARAVRWKNGQITNLGSLDDDICAFAYGSNSSGQIVGSSIACGDNPTSRAFLWEDGGPMVDLNSLIPPGSGFQLGEATLINEKGEIVVAATLDNGETHAALLIPNGDAPSKSASGQSRATVAPADQSSTSLTDGKVTPEMLAAMRARFANRHRGFGFTLPKKSN